jgi:hypothetical protein
MNRVLPSQDPLYAVVSVRHSCSPAVLTSVKNSTPNNIGLNQIQAIAKISTAALNTQNNAPLNAAINSPRKRDPSCISSPSAAPTSPQPKLTRFQRFAARFNLNKTKKSPCNSSPQPICSPKTTQCGVVLQENKKGFDSEISAPLPIKVAELMSPGCVQDNESISFSPRQPPYSYSSTNTQSSATITDNLNQNYYDSAYSSKISEVHSPRSMSSHGSALIQEEVVDILDVLNVMELPSAEIDHKTAENKGNNPDDSLDGASSTLNSENNLDFQSYCEYFSEDLISAYDSALSSTALIGSTVIPPEAEFIRVSEAEEAEEYEFV